MTAVQQPSWQSSTVVAARYWHLLDDGRLQCDLCPRFCKLHEDQQGLCFVRARQGEEMVLTTYGRSSGFCIDPIEKKPVTHFMPGSKVFSVGTTGCNWLCKYCINFDLSQRRKIEGVDITPEEVVDQAIQTGCNGSAYTYIESNRILEQLRD